MESTVDYFTDYHEWVRAEYNRRVRVNPRYSIRAFAQLLNLNSSTVSQILSGKRKLSAKQLKKLFVKLEAPPSIQKQLLEGTTFTTQAPEYNLVTQDSFAVISEWYHYAILELTYVQDFKNDYQWIAKKLNITIPEVRSAIERLKRLNLLTEKNGKLTKAQKNITNFDKEITNAALKILQRQFIHMAAQSLETTPVHERDMSSMTMAVDDSKITEAKILITQMRRAICDFLETGNATRVYHLGIQLYPVSTNSEEKIKYEV